MGFEHKKVERHVTTMQLPVPLYEKCLKKVDSGEYSSLNDLYLYAIRRLVDERPGTRSES